MLSTVPYREPGERARKEYRFTPAGRDLQPVLTALMDWGDRHGGGGAPLVLRHDGCGQPVHAQLVCESGHAVTSPRELVPEQAG